MLNDNNLDRNDGLGQLLNNAYSKMTPPPALEKAVKTGVPYTPKVNTKIHVRRFAKAIVSYAVCVALLIGGVYLASQLFSKQKPIATNPPSTTTVKDPQNTDKPDDPNNPPAVEFPYTALPNNTDLLLELAQYGSLEVMDAKLNALGLKLSAEPAQIPTYADVQTILRDLGYNVCTTLKDPLEDVSQSYQGDSVYTAIPIAIHSAETGELIVIHSLANTSAVNTYHQFLMMVLKPEGYSYTCIANFRPDNYFTGHTPSETGEQYGIQRLFDVLALTGTQLQLDSYLSEEECKPLQDYLRNSKIIETRMSFYQPKDYNLYELALADSRATALEIRKYKLSSGDDQYWRKLNRTAAEGYYRSYLGITLTEEIWADLNQQCWDGSNDVLYPEAIDTYFVYMEKENNLSNVDEAFKAWRTTDGRMVVSIVNDTFTYVTALLNPTENGSYHIEAVQVLTSTNIPK